jgi:hypothetical protein
MFENLGQAIPETSGNNNPLLPPKRHIKENPEDNNKKFNYIDDYLNVIQRVGRDNHRNRTLATAITKKKMGLVQQTAPLNRSQITLANRPQKKALPDFDGEIKSEFCSWK